ncbi:unnamed protein product [Hapterophycus canaliculatus]
MSLFGGLDDGVVESIPTLIDEDLEDLFAGGEDLFELLDERVPTPLVIPPAPIVADTPVVVETPVVESGEPSGYTTPVFFPFGKPEPTAPQLKLSGVSSFKKINSRLLQGGALSEKEEIDAIRELERALGVLGHQRRFLKEHKTGLEKWAAAVYGISLSTEAFGATEAASTATGDRGQGPQHVSGGSKTMMREVRVSLKCKGAKRRMDKQPLIAHVDQSWSPRHNHLKGAKKRSSGKTEAEKSAKRGKPPAPKVAQAIVIRTNSVASSAEETMQDDPVARKSDGVPDALGAPDQAWTWLEDCTSLPCVSGGLPPAEDGTIEAEEHVGRRSFSSRAEETGAKTATEPGIRPDRLEDDADILRQRLVQALATPVVMESGLQSGMKPKPCPEATRTTPSRTDAVHLLDVTQLSLAQRILVQLNYAGLTASSSNRGQLCEHPAGRGLP